MELIPADLQGESTLIRISSDHIANFPWELGPPQTDGYVEWRHTYRSKRYALPVLPWKFYTTKGYQRNLESGIWLISANKMDPVRKSKQGFSDWNSIN